MFQLSYILKIIIVIKKVTDKKNMCVYILYMCVEIATNTSTTQSHFAECIFGRAKEFYIKRNNKKVDSTETGRIVIAHLLL